VFRLFTISPPTPPPAQPHDRNGWNTDTADYTETARISSAVSSSRLERQRQVAVCCWNKNSQHVPEPTVLVAHPEQIRVGSVHSAVSVFRLFTISPPTPPPAQPPAQPHDRNGWNTETMNCTEQHG